MKRKFDDPIRADFPSGKRKKDGTYTTSQAQRGPSCVLYSARKFAFFPQDEKDEEVDKKEVRANSPYYKAYKIIKRTLAEVGNGKNDELQLDGMQQACLILGINSQDVIMASRVFKEDYSVSVGVGSQEVKEAFYQEWPACLKHHILYIELLKHIFPYFDLTSSDWDPQQGVDGLREVLADRGALMVNGKLGASFHSGKPILHETLSSPHRQIHYFLPGSYIGTKKDNYHAVIVDEIATYQGKDMVFFRDPNVSSIPMGIENVYMISYDSFCQRIKAWNKNTNKENDVYLYHHAKKHHSKAR